MEEQQTLSMQSVTLSACLHAVIVLALLYFIQETEQPLRPEDEPAVVFLPTSQAPAAAGSVQPMQAQPQAQAPEEPTVAEPTQEQPDEQPIAAEQPHTSTAQRSSTTWSPERARRAWKKEVAAPQQQRQHAVRAGVSEGVMHDILDGIPIEEKSAPLSKRIQAQWAKSGQEHYHYAVIKAICYELNKQKIMEAPVNLPDKLTFHLTIERSGKLLEAHVLDYPQTGYAARCLRGIEAGSPYRPAPASIKEDPIVMTFVLHNNAEFYGDRTSHVPTPVVFSIS